MQEVLKVNIGDIVREILNYDFPTDEKSMNKHLALLTAYTLYKLSSVFKVDNNILNIIDDDWNDDRGVSVYNPDDRSIAVSRFKLKDEKGYLNDLLSLFHESYHYACDEGTFDGKKYAANKTILMNNSFDVYGLIYSLIEGRGIFKGIGEDKTYEELDRLMHINEGYSFSEYFLEPAEIFARQYSIDTVKEIIGIAKGFDNLSVNEIKRILLLENGVKDYEVRLSKKKLRSEEIIEKYKSSIVDYISRARDKVLEEDESGRCFLDKYKHFSRNDHINLQISNGNITTQLLLTLFIDYNEELASKLFDAMINVEDENERYKNVSNAKALCECTQFVPTDEQLEKLNKNIEFRNENIKKFAKWDVNQLSNVTREDTERIIV